MGSAAELLGALVGAGEKALGEGVGDAHLVLEAGGWLDGGGLTLLLLVVVGVRLLVGLLLLGKGEHVEARGAVGERGEVVEEARRGGLGFAVRGFVVRDVGEETEGWAGGGGLVGGGVRRDVEVLEGVEARWWGAAGEGGLRMVFGWWLGGTVGLGLLHQLEEELAVVVSGYGGAVLRGWMGKDRLERVDCVGKGWW